MHDLYYNQLTDQFSFMGVRDPAWHQLGNIIAEPPESYEEVLQLSGGNFTVDKLPNIHVLPSGISRPAIDSFYTFRTDTEDVIGEHVTSDYKIVQNDEFFSMFDQIVKSDKGIKYETAGVLKSGCLTFATATLPNYIRIGNSDDVSRAYLLGFTGHNGKIPNRFCIIYQRVVCANTLNAALKDCTNEFYVKHTENAMKRLDQAKNLMIGNLALYNAYNDLYNEWAHIRISDTEMVTFIKEIFAPNGEVLKKVKEGQEDDLSTRFKNQVAKMMEYYLTADTLQMTTTKGTLWGAFNLVSDFYQNVLDFKTSEDKFNSIIIDGTAKTRVQKAFNWCLKFMKGK